MGRRGLIAAVLCAALALRAGGAAAQGSAVRVPTCSSDRVDIELLRSLLSIEDALADWIVDVGADLCGEGDAVTVYFVGSDHVPIAERIPIPADADPMTNARVIALSIRERIPVVSDTVTSDEMPAPGETVEGDSPSATNTATADEPHVTDALGAPAARPETVRASSGEAPAAPPPLGPVDHFGRWTFAAGPRGRLASPLPFLDVPSYGVGAWLAVSAPIDRLWGIRIELASLVVPSTFDGSFEVLGVSAVALELFPLRNRDVDVWLAPRLELGGAGVYAWANDPVQPWIAAGGEAGTNLWLNDGLALGIAVGAAGVLVGGPVVERDGVVAVTVLNLSPVFLDLGVHLIAPL